MATEARQESRNAGLVKRGVDTVRTAFDETQSNQVRAKAAGTVAVAVGAPVVGGILGVDLINSVDPGLWSALGPYTGTAWIATAAAGGAAVLTSAIGGITVASTRDYYGDQKKMRYRGNLRSTFSVVKTAALVGTGVAGVIAAGLTAGDALHMGGLSEGAQVMRDITLAGGITALAAHTQQKLWATGLPPVRKAIGGE